MRYVPKETNKTKRESNYMRNKDKTTLYKIIIIIMKTLRNVF